VKKISWWHTEIGKKEEQNVLNAFKDRSFSMGPVAKELERRIALALRVPYVVVTTSGTSAITMALLSIGIKPGDEVIVPDLTWIATANAAAILGARVVLADCLPDAPLIDPEEVKKKITSKTKAVIAVHMNGRSCALKELSGIADKAGIVLIEDACKAFMSKNGNRCLGTFGRLGCFSLGMVSLVSACYGGAVATRDKELYRKLLIIRNQGVPPDGEERYALNGFNFKFSDILASIGVAQMEALDKKSEHVRKVYTRYCEGLEGLSFISMIPVDTGSGEIPLLAEVRSRDIDRLIPYLDRNNVEALRFHLPLHLAAYLKNKGRFPNASRFAREGFVLPCGPSQPLENVDHCIKLLQKWRSNDEQ